MDTFGWAIGLPFSSSSFFFISRRLGRAKEEGIYLPVESYTHHTHTREALLARGGGVEVVMHCLTWQGSDHLFKTRKHFHEKLGESCMGQTTKNLVPIAMGQFLPQNVIKKNVLDSNLKTFDKRSHGQVVRE